MGYLDPLLPAVPSLLLGISILVYLTTYPRRIWLAITSCILSIALIALAFYAIPKGIEFYIAIPLSILLFIVGYTAATVKVLSREDKRDIPRLTRSVDDLGAG
jgi:peptidoglycan/LPS O-acetylase OafA/YrhL